LNFEEAYKNKVVVECEGEPLHFMSADDLVRNKKATGRDQDLVDAKWMESKREKFKS